ncbi:MAG: hypothetical protein U0414_27740 [Polyangiaceae bacterium]
MRPCLPVALLVLASGFVAASCIESEAPGDCTPLPDDACTRLTNIHACDPPGPAKPAEDCSVDACVAGAVCVIRPTTALPEPVRLCEALCVVDAECEPGTVCRPIASEFEHDCGPAGVSTCTQRCNLATNEGCPTPNTRCMRVDGPVAVTRCDIPRAGGVGEGAACAFGASEAGGSPCSAWLVCKPTAMGGPFGTCHRMCTTDGLTECPGDSACVPSFTTLDGTEYGVCACDTSGNC